MARVGWWYSKEDCGTLLPLNHTKYGRATKAGQLQVAEVEELVEAL